MNSSGAKESKGHGTARWRTGSLNLNPPSPNPKQTAPLFFKRQKTSMTDWAMTASRPVVGSSAKMTEGFVSNSLAMLSRFFSPPLIPLRTPNYTHRKHQDSAQTAASAQHSAGALISATLSEALDEETWHGITEHAADPAGFHFMSQYRTEPLV